MLKKNKLKLKYLITIIFIYFLYVLFKKSKVIEGHNEIERESGTPTIMHGVHDDELDEQKPDKNIIPFSFINKLIHIPQLSCFITHTNLRTHKIISDNLFKSPISSGIAVKKLFVSTNLFKY